MQEFEVERKPQGSQRKTPMGFVYNSDTGKMQRNAEGWGKEDHIYLFYDKSLGYLF